MGIMIRPAGQTDADELVALCGQLGYTIEKSALCHNLAMISENPYAMVFVAQADNGKVVGFIGVERRVMLESPPRIEITGLVVDAAARRQRIASHSGAPMRRQVSMVERQPKCSVSTLPSSGDTMGATDMAVLT